MGSSAVGIYTAGRAQRQREPFSLSVEGDDLCSRYNWRRRMRGKRWLLAGIALCLLTGMRDPFKPPEDLCRISELSQWRYQGIVGRGERIIGVIKDGQKKWRRVQQNDVLENGWTILQLTPDALTLGTGTNCEPPHWLWQRQGDTNEAMDSRTTVDADTRRTGGKAAKVTLMVDDVPVAQVLQALAEQEKLNWSCRQTSAVRCRYI